MQTPSMLAASINDPVIQAMYASRLGQPSDASQTADDQVDTVSGIVKIAPATPVNEAASEVDFSIDGAVVDSWKPSAKRREYDWDSAAALNGVHTIRIEARTDDGGIVHRETRTVRVNNAPDAMRGTQQSNMNPADYARIEARLWTLLRPRRSRAAAEIVLSRLGARAGDRDDAATHGLIAEALDPQLTRRVQAAEGRLGGVRTARNGDTDIGVWFGDTTRPRVALTFDDGPNTSTAGLLDALDRAHATATFFIIGTRAEVDPDDVRRMASHGYEVENHSYTHPNISQCLPAMVESEILRTNIIIRSLTGHYPHFFQPPGGNASDTLARLSEAYGLRLAFWSIDALKSEDAGSVTGLVRYGMKHVHPGSIILMHNGPLVTINAVPALVDALHARGYQIVSLNEVVRARRAVSIEPKKKLKSPMK